MSYENSSDSNSHSSPSGGDSMGAANTSTSSSERGSNSPKEIQLHPCAYCGNKFDRQTTPCMPFCSIRCQRIDLGNWLNEAYTMPTDGSEEGEWDQSE